jgi:hypothetical protein
MRIPASIGAEYALETQK